MGILWSGSSKTPGSIPEILGKMKFFWKRRTSGSRRHARLWAQQLKTIGLFGGGFLALTGLLLWAWLSGAILSAGSWIHDKTLSVTAAAGFTVDEILVTGRSRIAPEDLLARLNIHVGDPIFDVSIAEGQQKIAESSWIDSVTVSRRLPDTIVVAIKERQPAALWQYQKKISLIDAQGYVLSQDNLDTYNDLPLVVGEHAPENVLALLGLLRAEPEIAEMLTAAVRVGNRRWDLQLQNGLLVKLPEENVELALRKLALSHKNKNLLERDLKQIDLRIPEKLVIEPVERAAEATPI